MSTKGNKYWVGPYSSCFFAVYGRSTDGKVWVVGDKPMTEAEANEELKRVELFYKNGGVI